MPRLIDVRTQSVIISHLELADTFWRRFVGLQFRKQLPAGHALWLLPCSSIHTCFMRMTIDVIMLDEQQTVVGIRRGVRPWRAVLCDRRTRSVIETCQCPEALQVGSRVALIEAFPGVAERLK